MSDGRSSLDHVIASHSESKLTLDGLLRNLHQRGRLASIVREALAVLLIQEQARLAGLSAADHELQAAAADFRRRNGLASLAETPAWLARQGLSMDDFEARLEQDLLAAKLRQHLTAAAVDGAFAAHPVGFERLRLAEVVVPR